MISTFHNRKQKTLACLASLYKQKRISDEKTVLDVYLCDDGATDGTTEEIRKYYPQVHVIHGTGMLFWAKGMSLALSEAVKTEHDFYLMVNDDVDFYQDMLVTMLQSYDLAKTRAKLIAIVGSTQSRVDGKWTYGGQQWNKKLLHERYDPVLPDATCPECNMTNWNCFLIPGQMLKEIGMMDDYYEHAKADNDYSNRIVASGNKIFVASKYIGVCERNPLTHTWRDVSLPLKERLQLVKKPNGLPYKSELHYCRKFHGKAWPLWFAKRYLWIYITACNRILKGK